MYNFNKDLIYFIKRDGTPESPYQNIEEKIYVLYEKAFLKEVPVQSLRLNAKIGNEPLVEVNRLEDLKFVNNYFVNYRQGIVYFHSSQNNKEVTLTYKGQGVLLYPASRIYVDTEDGARDVVRTLRDLIEEGGTALDAVREINEIIKNAEESLENIDATVLRVDDAINRVDLKTTEITNAEIARVSQELIRKTNEDSRNTEEIKRVQADGQRDTNESARNTAETQRQTNEQSRRDTEVQRNTAEGLRKSAEDNRLEKENERQSEEVKRNTAEGIRNTEEIKRNDAETLRNTSEEERKTHEVVREENEVDRTTRETAREEFESARNTKEQERIASEILRNEAEELRKSQETKRQQDTSLAIDNVNKAKSDTEMAIAEVNTAIQSVNEAVENVDSLVDNTKYTESFSSTTTYVKNNIVGYNGSAYIAKDTTVGNLPTNEIYWGLLAQRGIDGAGSVSSVNNILPDLDGNVNINIEELGAERLVRKGAPNGYAGLDANGKVPLSQVPDTLKQRTYVVTNTTERLALTDLISGDKAFEKETGDSYIYDGEAWDIMADADWENVSLDWTNITNKPNSSVTSIDKAVTDSHTHGNKNVLDGFTVVDGKLKYNGLNIGNVDSVNGKTGVVTITPEDIGAYTKQEVDALIENHTSIEVVNNTPTTLDKNGVLFIKKSVINAETPE